MVSFPSSIPAPRGGYGGAPVINRPPGANVPIPAMPGGGVMPLSQMLRMGTAFQQGAAGVRGAPAMQNMEERTAGSIFPGLQMQEGGPVDPSSGGGGGGGGGGDLVGYRDLSQPSAPPPIAGADVMSALESSQAPAMSPYATGYGGPRRGEVAQSYQTGGAVSPVVHDVPYRHIPTAEHAHENIINRRMLIRHAQTDRPKAKRLLQGLKREHHGLRMTAAIALARQHDDHGVHLLNHAATKIPDGMHTHFQKVGPDHFVARVYHQGNHDHALLNRGQMLQYATGPAGGFDHTLDNGVHKNLHILTTMSHLHDPVRPPRMGYQEGGEVADAGGGTIGAGDTVGAGGDGGTITGPQMSDEIVKELERQKEANPEFFKQPAGGDETPVDPAGQPGSTYPSENPLERQALPGDPEGGPAAKRGTSERAGAPPVPKQDLRDPAIPQQGSTEPPKGSQTRSVEPPVDFPTPPAKGGPAEVTPAPAPTPDEAIPTPRARPPDADIPPAPPGKYRGPTGPGTPNYVPPGGDPGTGPILPPRQIPDPKNPGGWIPDPNPPPAQPQPGTTTEKRPNDPGVAPAAGGGGGKLPVVPPTPGRGGIDLYQNPEKYGMGRRGYHGPVDEMGSPSTPLQPGELPSGPDLSITGMLGQRLSKPLGMNQIDWDRHLHQLWYGDTGDGGGGRRRRRAEGGPVGYQEGGEVEAAPAPSNGGGGSLYDSSGQFGTQTEQQAQPGFKADVRELMSGRGAGAAGDVRFPSEFSKNETTTPSYTDYPPGKLGPSGEPRRTEEPGEYAGGGIVQHVRHSNIIHDLVAETRREHGIGRRRAVRRGYQEGGEVYNEPDVYSQVGTPWDYTNGTGAGAASPQELADARIAERNADMSERPGDFLVRQARERQPGDFGQAGAEGTQVADFSSHRWPVQDFSSEIYMPGGGGGRRRHRGGGGGGGRGGGEGGGQDVTLPSQEAIAEQEAQGGSPAGLPRQAGAPPGPDTRTQEEKEQDIYNARQQKLQPMREAQQRDIAAERLRQIGNGTIRPGDPLVNPYDEQILRRFPMGGGSEGPWGEASTRSTRSYAALDRARTMWNRKYVLGAAEGDRALTNQPRGGGSFVDPFSKYPAGRDVMPSDRYGRSPAAQAEQGTRPYTRDIPSPQIMSGDEYEQRDRESQRRFGNIPGPAPAAPAGTLPATPGEEVVPMDVTGVTRSGQGPQPGDMTALDIQQAQETQRRAAQLPVAPPLAPPPPAAAAAPQPPAQPQRLPFTPGSQDDPLRNMPGRATVVPRGRPAADDFAGIARQAFPMASQGPQREAYERQLRAQAAEQAGKERIETLKGESKQAVEEAKTARAREGWDAHQKRVDTVVAGRDRATLARIDDSLRRNATSLQRIGVHEIISNVNAMLMAGKKPTPEQEAQYKAAMTKAFSLLNLDLTTGQPADQSTTAAPAPAARPPNDGRWFPNNDGSFSHPDRPGVRFDQQGNQIP